MKNQPIQFCKMHGLGNDFVVIDAIHQSIDIKKLPIQPLAHRHLGIGFDQLLAIEPSTCADFSCRIFNSDGSEAEQCGNGLRCVTRFVHEQGLIKQPSLAIETKAGIFSATILDYDHIQIAMGIPSWQSQKTYVIALKEHTPVSATVVSVGNPHAIVRVPALNNIPITHLGMEISTHPLFPFGTNVGFVEVIQPNHIRLRTYERGSGETYACGSNACAAVVAGISNQWLAHRVEVEFQYGSLQIEWAGESHPVIMQGPATLSFSGEFIVPPRK